MMPRRLLLALSDWLARITGRLGILRSTLIPPIEGILRATYRHAIVSRGLDAVVTVLDQLGHDIRIAAVRPSSGVGVAMTLITSDGAV